MRGADTAPELLRWQALLVEKGYTARTVPKEYGGFGAEPDLLKTIIIEEEFQQARVALGMENQGISMFVPTLLQFGSDEQKRRYVEPTILGQMIWCQGYSEPGSGQRSREPHDQRDPRRRPLRRQRPEDLDQHREGSADDVRARSHRARSEEARRHQLSADRHEDARHRGPAAEDHDRRRVVQRSILRRRARAEGEPRRASAARAGRSAPRPSSTSATCSAAAIRPRPC